MNRNQLNQRIHALLDRLTDRQLELVLALLEAMTR